MAKKKKDRKNPFRNRVTDEEADDTITLAEVKEFKGYAKKKKEDWQNMAERSWREIKKRNRNGRPSGGWDLDNPKNRKKRFPLWWSCLMIRQPITFARLPIPVLKDTQGDDPLGRTACVIGERLTKGILKTFDAFTPIEQTNKDFLVTNIGWGRGYYKREEIQEDEKMRVQAIPPQIDPQTQQPIPAPPTYAMEDGQIIEDSSKVLMDELGPYVLTGRKVSVDNECVYLSSGLYSNLYLDPDMITWPPSRLIYEYQMSYREFKKKFGQKGLDALSVKDYDDHKSGKSPIIINEYWDDYLKECRWFADTSESFLQPEGMAKEGEQKPDHSDLYGLSGFYPMAEPLVINNSTDEYWPTPEYFQVIDIIDDVHNIASRMMLLTKAIRVRFLLDGSLPSLAQLVNETDEAGGIVIPNLSDALIKAGGDITNLVAYFPVAEMIQGLENMYKAFDQRLNMFYQVTGVSDLLRGQTSDGDKTFGERQMEGKFALNRIEPFQNKLQRWIKESYELLMEMALKMFSDDSLDEYITPQTLDPEDKKRYVPALELLRSNKRRRFRVEFETDSTIAINQQWKKQQATELANTLTKAMESTAKIAETQPELAGTELKVLKHLIGEFSEGKLFIDEIQESIEKVIEKVSQPKNEPPDPTMLKIQVEDKFKNLQLQTQTQIEIAKLQQKNRADVLKSQTDQLKLAIEQGATQDELRLKVADLQASIAQGWEELTLKREALIAQIQAESGAREIEQFRLMLEARVAEQEMTLKEAGQHLEQFMAGVQARDSEVSLKERVDTERRLQEEHEFTKQSMVVDAEAKQIDAIATLTNSLKPEAPKANISVDLSKTLQVKPVSPTKSKVKKP